MKQTKHFLILTLLSLTISCVKVDEAPIKVPTDPIKVTLDGLNNCYIDSDLPYASSYTLDIPITDFKHITIESVTLKINDEKFESNDISIFKNAISLGYCFLFGDSELFEGTATIHATNYVGEKIESSEINFTIERPLGAN